MKRVFLVGCPRSGTTMLQLLLTGHREIWSFPESHFFSVLLQDRTLLGRVLGLATAATGDHVQAFATKTGMADGTWCIARLPGAAKRCSRRFLKTLDRDTAMHGKHVWLEKTPDHVFYVDFIQRVAPDARIIHLLRDGRDVVASLYVVTRRYPERWHGEWDLERCIEHWERSVSISVAACSSRPSHNLLVGYENTTRHPEETLRRICQFVDVTFDENMLTGRADSSSRVIENWERWKEELRGPVEIRSGRKFGSEFSQEQRDYITRRVSSTNELMSDALRQAESNSLSRNGI